MVIAGFGNVLHSRLSTRVEKSGDENMKPKKQITESNRLSRVTVDEDTKKVIFHDLECLQITEMGSNRYHYNLLKANLTDLLGCPQ